MALLTRIRHALRMLALATASSLSQFPPAGAAVPTLEYAVKANFLVRFAPFVEWPEGSFATPAAPVRLCIVGTDPFRGLIDQAVKGQQVAGRAFVVARHDEPGPAMACHILYSRAAGRDLETILKAVEGKPVLTVTERNHERTSPVIRFVLRDGRVRFAVDTRPAVSGGLKVSSKLLDLAVSVDGPEK